MVNPLIFRSQLSPNYLITHRVHKVLVWVFGAPPGKSVACSNIRDVPGATGKR